MRRQPDGFSLIELLIVIAVLSILLSILSVPLAKARRLAMLTTCKTNLRTMHGANMDFMQNNDWHKPEIGYRIEDNVVILYFAGTTTKMDGKPVGQGKVLDYLGDNISPMLCPSVAIKGDNEADREAWENSDRAGSSYLYEWYHPPTQGRRVLSPWPTAFDDWLETLRFTNLAGNDALLLDLNFENVPGVDKPFLSHKYVRKVNVLHNDGTVIGYDYDDGLYGLNWAVQDVIDMMDNAHNLRGIH